jgi:hypothetical protein
MVPEGLTITSGALVGTAVADGADVAPENGTAVGAAVVAVSPVDGIGVAVAEEPQANMAANRRAKDPRIINFGFFNQLIKMDQPPTVFGNSVIQCLFQLGQIAKGILVSAAVLPDCGFVALFLINNEINRIYAYKNIIAIYI